MCCGGISFIALQWIQLSYFFLGFFVDIMPHSKAKVLLQDFVDTLFTVVAFPMSMVNTVCMCDIVCVCVCVFGVAICVCV